MTQRRVHCGCANTTAHVGSIGSQRDSCIDCGSSTSSPLLCSPQTSTRDPHPAPGQSAPAGEHQDLPQRPTHPLHLRDHRSHQQHQAQHLQAAGFVVGFKPPLIFFLYSQSHRKHFSYCFKGQSWHRGPMQQTAQQDSPKFHRDSAAQTTPEGSNPWPHHLKKQLHP